MERFNRTVRYEWLAQYLFDTVGEVQGFATQWLWNYDHEPQNTALGGFTTKQRLAMAAQFLSLLTVKNGGITVPLAIFKHAFVTIAISEN